MPVVLVLGLRAGRRRHFQVHLKIAYPGNVPQRRGNGFANLSGNLWLVFREPDKHADIPAVNADILYHAEGDDVAAVTGVGDRLQHVVHLRFGGFLASEHEAASSGVDGLKVDSR